MIKPMKKLKYAIWLVVLLFIAYNSVYFKKLSEVKAADHTNFNAATYAQNFWKSKLPGATAKAVELNDLLLQLTAQPAPAFKNHGHAMAIGSTRFFMVKGKGKVLAINADNVKLLLDGGENEIQIATEYVFGNAVRDASGLININDFVNTLDLSNVSAGLNKIIRKQVLPPFKSKVKKGDTVSFTGAIELNEAHLRLNEIELIPVTLTL
jgi:predicted lipoprotein